MKKEFKLDHEFLFNHLSILELVVKKSNRFDITWDSVVEMKRKYEDTLFEVLVRMIPDHELPEVHFLVTSQDGSFDHAFGTHKRWDWVYKNNSVALSLYGEFIPCEVLKTFLTKSDFDKLEEMAAKQVNSWEGPYE